MPDADTDFGTFRRFDEGTPVNQMTDDMRSAYDFSFEFIINGAPCTELDRAIRALHRPDRRPHCRLRRTQPAHPRQQTTERGLT